MKWLPKFGGGTCITENIFKVGYWGKSSKFTPGAITKKSKKDLKGKQKVYRKSYVLFGL